MAGRSLVPRVLPGVLLGVSGRYLMLFRFSRVLLFRFTTRLQRFLGFGTEKKEISRHPAVWAYYPSRRKQDVTIFNFQTPVGHWSSQTYPDQASTAPGIYFEAKSPIRLKSTRDRGAVLVRERCEPTCFQWKTVALRL